VASALDLACGTGNSTAPLLSRGYAVVGCDISPCIIRAARDKYAEHGAEFCVADMRELPPLGEFDLVLCLDDAINYLLSEEGLEATFRGVRAVLAPGGVFAFDANSLLTYRPSFAEDMVKEGDGMLMAGKVRRRPPSDAAA
jgi:SAM-dependent methyltransferase